jgi:hypothetical protein
VVLSEAAILVLCPKWAGEQNGQHRQQVRAWRAMAGSV